MTDQPHRTVDPFLIGLAEARLIDCCLRLGLIDAFDASQHGLTIDDVRTVVSSGGTSLRGLMDIDAVITALTGIDVVSAVDDRFVLSNAFTAALANRDLLEAKLRMGMLAARDLLDDFEAIVTDLQSFTQRSRTFGQFAYDAAAASDEAAIDRCVDWVSYLSTLTRYEAPEILERYDFGGHHRVLDIGGNSGELARALCAAHADLRVEVFDLPAVIEIAKRLVASDRAADRITTTAGDVRRDPLPERFDLVVMKSFLHDWNDADADLILDRATRSLEPGGTLLIVERSRFGAWGPLLPFRLWPMLLFGSALPGPTRCRSSLERLGLTEIGVVEFDLDTPWFILTARRPDGNDVRN